MKQAINRFLCYIAALTLFEVLTGGFESAPGHTLKAQLGFYIGYYVLGWGFWIAIAESVYQLIQWRRRRQQLPIQDQPTKELPVPDNQPLQQKPIDEARK
jgi:hypothetical protein